MYRRPSSEFCFEDSFLLAYDGASIGNWIPTSRNVGLRSTSDAKPYARTEILLDTYVKILKLGRNFVFESDWYNVCVLYSLQLNFAHSIRDEISRNVMEFLSGLPRNLLQVPRTGISKSVSSMNWIVSKRVGFG